jgi:Ca2+:H+ antiporter
MRPQEVDHMAAMMARLAVGWGAVALFVLFGPAIFAAAGSGWGNGLLFAALLAIIMWSAFGVVGEADHLAEMLGEPLGTLVLTLSIVLIEVALISAVMLGDAEPTLGRDTMFAVLMIVLNGVVGLALLIGGWRYHVQSYNFQGATSFLAVILPLTVVTLILPNFTRSTPGGTLSLGQQIAFTVFTLALYGTFLALQTGRHRDFFVGPEEDGAGPAGGHHERANRREIAIHTGLLVLSVLPVVLLAKQLAKVLDKGIDALGAPPALGGVTIAVIVFTPEAIAALRAVTLNKLQRTVNLCLGAAASTIGLTVPAVLALAAATGQNVVLGLDPAEMVLLVLTLILNLLTFTSKRTTTLHGAMHLMVFCVYGTLIFNP